MSNVVDDLTACLRDPSRGQDDLIASARAFFTAMSRGTPPEVAAGMRALAETFSLDDARRGGFAATLCGAMIEKGADPAPIVDTLLARLGDLLPRAEALARACEQQLPEGADGDEGQEEGSDPGEHFEDVRRELAASMPEGAKAWDDLEHFWPPAVALFSVSPQARAAAAHLVGPAATIGRYHTAGHWLSQIIPVLDDEPFVAIEPSTGLGIEGRFSGIADNFQLHVILMHAFPQAGFFSKRRVSRSAANVALGEGPQQTEQVVIGAWNLYTWRAAGPDLTLPDKNDHRHWVWGEGKPADIPVFEGRRVILLGPPAYERTWRSQRLFDPLPARLTVTETLKRPAVDAWLRRMADAAAASPAPQESPA